MAQTTKTETQPTVENAPVTAAIAETVDAVTDEARELESNLTARGRNAVQELTTTARDLGDNVVETGRNAYFAGLGIVATVDERTRGVVDDLIARGKRYTDGDTAEAGFVQAISGAVRDRVDETTRQVKTARTDLEHSVEGTVTRVLHRLGVPSRNEVESLINRIDRLTTKVDDLIAKRG
ncbi:MAG: phasin family protein [Acidobacteriota bacterium]